MLCMSTQLIVVILVLSFRHPSYCADPVRASENVWLPFMKNDLQCDADTIIVGHSSGAAAAMRFAEQYKVAGMVYCLVAPQ